MATTSDIQTSALPVPIFRISTDVERYMVFDINTVTWLRKEHHILGVLVGTLHQVPQQNLFLGLPLELMPEEARLLVEKKIAYTVSDREWQGNVLPSLSPEQVQNLKQDLAREAANAAKAAEQKKLESTERAMRKLRINSTPPPELSSKAAASEISVEVGTSEGLFDREDTLSISADASIKTTENHGWHVTPTTTYLPLPTNSPLAGEELPNVKPASYALFKHLHERDYFMTPGLRFGCEFCVYPGDPLRYHSHFLAVSADWDEELDLLDIIGSGRLATGVKKGFLLGGLPKVDDHGDVEVERVRAFSIEWAAM